MLIQGMNEVVYVISHEADVVFSSLHVNCASGS